MGMQDRGRRVNAAVEQLAHRVDDQTGEVARNAAHLLAFAIRILRWPSLALLVLPIPFIGALALIALASDTTWLTVVAALVAVGCAAVSFGFGLRRFHILKAGEDPDRLATELGVAVALSDDVDDAREALGQLVSGGTRTGFGVFNRLKGLWAVTGTGADVLTDATDLPHARWFFPPKIGTTVTLFFAALWNVPVAFGSCLILAIALAAR